MAELNNKQILDYINKSEIDKILEEFKGLEIEQIIELVNLKLKQLSDKNQNFIEVVGQNFTENFESRMQKMEKLLDL